MDVDLNVDNYSLEEILQLFKLPYHFNASHLKQAKKIVLKTHPDKSNLPSTYFLFYSKAFKLLHNIHEFRCKAESSTSPMDANQAKDVVDYDRISSMETDSDESKQKSLHTFLKQQFNMDLHSLHSADSTNQSQLQKRSEFNEWFNKTFEEQKVQTKDDGYGDWFSSSENNELFEGLSIHDTQELESRRKQMIHQTQSLQKYEGVQELASTPNLHSMSSSLGTLDGCDDYSSDSCGALCYQDLRQAHSKPLLDVCESDIMREKIQFNNVQEYKSYRHQQNLVPLNEIIANKMLETQYEKESELAVKRAFELAQQNEASMKKQKQFWNSLQLIANGK
jgi:hypothetical protein